MFAAIACTITGVLPSFLVAGLASLVRADLHFNEAVLGLIIGAFYAASAITAIPGGRLAERLGPRRGLILGLLLAAASLSAVALLARSPVHLAALLAVGGASNGVMQSAGNLAIARGVRQERLGIALGIKQSAVPTATMLAGFAVPLIGLTVGWRWAFAAGAAAAVALLGVVPHDVVDGDGAGAASSGAPPAPAALDRKQVRRLARIAVAVCCGAIAANSLGAFYVESAVAAGHPLAVAGLLLSLGSGAGIVVRLLLGWAADRTSMRPLPVIATMMTLGIAGYLGLAYGRGTAALVAATFVAFAAGWGWTGLLQLAVVQEHMEAPAAASGIAHAGALSGGLIGPVVFGWTVSNLGYRSAWTGIALVALAGGIVLLFTALSAGSPRTTRSS